MLMVIYCLTKEAEAINKLNVHPYGTIETYRVVSERVVPATKCAALRTTETMRIINETVVLARYII